MKCQLLMSKCGDALLVLFAKAYAMLMRNDDGVSLRYLTFSAMIADEEECHCSNLDNLIINNTVISVLFAMYSFLFKLDFA